MTGSGNDAPEEVYFEFTPVGNVVKVVAIHAGTGTEVSVLGPTSASRSDLQGLALRKLKARLQALAKP
jgi:hypothetical protein